MIPNPILEAMNELIEQIEIKLKQKQDKKISVVSRILLRKSLKRVYCDTKQIRNNYIRGI